MNGINKKIALLELRGLYTIKMHLDINLDELSPCDTLKDGTGIILNFLTPVTEL